MKQKRQLAALAVLVVVAVLVWSYVWNSHSPAVEAGFDFQNIKVLAVQNPQIRWGELDRAQKTEYKSNGRNPFSMIAPPTPQEVQKKKEEEDARKAQLPLPVISVPPPPTEAKLPPNLKYFGFGTVPNGSPRRAFFTDGEDIYVVPEGDTLLGRYRILKVGNANLEFQEISTGLHGTTVLEEPAAPPSA